MGIVPPEGIFQFMKSVYGDGDHRKRTLRKCHAANEPSGERVPNFPNVKMTLLLGLL